MARFIRLVALAGLAAALTLPSPASATYHAEGQEPPPSSPTRTITAHAFRFCEGRPCTPADAGHVTTVAVGTTVVWQYDDPFCDAFLGACRGHNVIFAGEDPADFDGDLRYREPGDVLNGPFEIRSVTFDQVGEFAYHCNPHQSFSMTGVVRVVEVAAL